MSRVLLVVLVCTACATTSATSPEAATEAPVLLSGGRAPVAFQLVPSRLPPDVALERAATRVIERGFDRPVPMQSERLDGREVGEIVRSSAEVPPDAEDAACSGSSEILQIKALAFGRGTQLRLRCYTEAEVAGSDAGGSCRRVAKAGCPVAGDRLLAEVALDAVGTL